MADQPQQQSDQSSESPIINRIAQNATDGNLGLSGIILKISQFSIVAIFCGTFLWLLNIMIVQGRADRLEDRTLFRESVKEIKDQADRHTDEIKGAIDKNTEVFKQWIEESRTMRRTLGLQARPPEAMPKPIPQPE